MYPQEPITPQEDPSSFDKVIQSLDAEQKAKLEEAQRQDQIGAVTNSGDKIVETLQNNTQELTSSIHDLLLATLVSKDPQITQVAKNLSSLLDAIGKATDNVKGANFQPLATQLKELRDTLREIPKQIEAANQAADPTAELREIAQTLGAKNWSPNISVKAPAVDLGPLNTVISEIKDALNKKTEIKTDNSKMEKTLAQVNESVGNVTKAINSLSFPSPNYVLPFKDSTGKAQQATLDANGNLSIVDTTAEAIAQAMYDAFVRLQPYQNAIPFARDINDQMRVVIGSGTVTNNTMAWGNVGSYPTYYATGGPNAVDAREQLELQSNTNFNQIRLGRWVIT